MDGDPDRRDAGQAARAAIGGARMGEIDAELVFLLAGRDLRMGARIDIGIDADRDRRDAAHALRDRAQRLELGQGFDIDLMHVMGEGEFQFALGLADAGEDDAAAGNAGGKGAAELAFRDDIGAGAELAQERDHGEIWIGFHRIADRRAEIAEAAGEFAIAPRDLRRRIDIAGRADLVGDERERGRLDRKRAAAIGDLGRPGRS